MVKPLLVPCPERVFRNLKNARRFAIDIGGSLAKVVYMSEITRRKSVWSCSEDEGESDICRDLVETAEPALRLHFVKTETKYIDKCIDFIKTELMPTCRSSNCSRVVKATGGGAHKYFDKIVSEIGCSMDRVSEIECVITGCNFLLKNINEEVFQFSKDSETHYKFRHHDDQVFPYLLVNIGSGVSIIKVLSDTEFERVGGTAMGGGTFWGLGSLLTDAKGFDELLKLATGGKSQNVDMLVKDIYGGTYEAMNLPGDLTASCFGKTVRASSDEPIDRSKLNQADIAKSLLHMISNDIAQIACLYARLYELKNIYFGGFFIRGNESTMHSISYGVSFWSKGEVTALFLRHEGYLGALGAFLKSIQEEAEMMRFTYDENFSLNASAIMNDAHSIVDMNGEWMSNFSMFELNVHTDQHSALPLLENSALYKPDTIDYLDPPSPVFNRCINVFKREINRWSDLALEQYPDSESRASKFRELATTALEQAEMNPISQGSCTVRHLLSIISACLRDAGYQDIYYDKKKKENAIASKLLQYRLDSLAKLSNEEKEFNLMKGLLAGNVFDWGSIHSAKLIREESFGFEAALKQIQPRPWLVDDYDLWHDTLKSKTYKSVLIFVDNSGFDFFLGVLPFAIDFIKRGAQVILAANHLPAVNDITFQEMCHEMKKLSLTNSIIAEVLSTNRLLLADSGSMSPCVDLCNLNSSLCSLVKNLKVDLIVLEGMGRAIYTNLNAMFTCDVLKLAVLKSVWVAESMFNGKIFDVVFKFEPQQTCNGETHNHNSNSL